ncbi:MAG: PQQ-dependent sugar dehydrogenase, partial [Planctomycetales bacterium]|nr:PQQ-dependent sugar dehydrogenase [Planctomycetales bacterium]
EVAFVNDGLTAGGTDRNLRVDAIAINGQRYEAEAADVYSTGAWVEGVGCEPGLWRSEFLPCGGSLQFGSAAQPGTLALGATLISVDETAGFVTIPVVRTGGSDGTVGLEYTTVDASASAGSDYAGQTGILVFGPGETAKNLTIAIADDAIDEGNETFNVAGDFVLGGATLGLPRTATVTIVDDDGAPTPGDGVGLLGEYYNDAALTEFVLARTDATVDFNWGSGSPDPAIGADTFSVRWTGQVESLFTETYTFYVTTDDGARLWIDDQLVIDSWIDQSPTVHSGQIALQGGQRVSVRLEFYENGGGAVQQLEWSSARQSREIVPQSQLYSDPADPIDGTFSGQTVAAGLNRPVAVDFDPDGRMFIAEQRGVVRLFANGQLLATPFIDIQSQVNNVQDRGLLGVAVHPQFPSVPYVYLSYTYDPPETAGRTGLAGPDGTGNRVARLTRVTADPATNYETAVAGSEVVLLGTNSVWANISSPDRDSTNDITIAPSCSPDGTLQNCLPADSRSHTIGNVAFGADGSLYVSNGDGTSFGRVDPRTVRVQDIDSLSGKLLRIDPLTGEGLPDNPFFNGDPNANRSKVVSYGLRNPFRYALHPDTQTPYI